MEDCNTDSMSSSDTQTSERSEERYLGFYKMLNLMMTDDHDLLQERISRLSERELSCLRWCTGAQSNEQLLRCTVIAQDKARQRRDAMLRHSFLQFTTWMMHKYGFYPRTYKSVKKEEALEQFIRVVYSVADEEALDYFVRCMSKGFSTRAIKKIYIACPALMHSYFDYFEKSYLQHKISRFERKMRKVVKKYALEQKQILKRTIPAQRPTNPFSVIQTIRTVSAMRLSLCGEMQSITLFKKLT
jgi:hypothetical protein